MTQKSELPEAEDRVADAPASNWVDRYAPRPARPYLRLSRADRPIGTWLLLIPCLWGLSLSALATGYRPWDLWLAAGCAIGAFLMRGAGCTWNDLTDRDIDARVARTRSRPLPSGQVSALQAGIWMIVQTLAAAVILFSYNTLAITLGIASLVLVAIYPFAKRVTWWPQAFLGLAFNWGALLAWAAHAGTIPVGAVFLYVGGIAWTLFYDTIYAHQDAEDDALIGVKSTARLFGTNSPAWLNLFLVASVLSLMIAVILTVQDNTVRLWTALAGVWAFGWHMLWQLRRLDINDPASCLAVFRSNRNAGLIFWLFLAAAAVV
jgi:4-hydroxybenzoate polyprenyltransferase